MLTCKKVSLRSLLKYGKKLLRQVDKKHKNFFTHKNLFKEVLPSTIVTMNSQ